MIAVPREDGGVTMHGSLQCPYYIHAALKRGMGFNDAQAHVVQAETGGGFGGKEEYPSVIALHAAILAKRAGRAVRMIYDTRTSRRRRSGTRRSSVTEPV